MGKDNDNKETYRRCIDCVNIQPLDFFGEDSERYYMCKLFKFHPAHYYKLVVRGAFYEDCIHPNCLFFGTKKLFDKLI